MTASYIGTSNIVDNGGGELSTSIVLPSYTGAAAIFVITGHAEGDGGTTRPSFSGGVDMGNASDAPNVVRFWFVDPGTGFTLPTGLSWKSSGITQYAYAEVWQGLDTGQNLAFTQRGRSATSVNQLPGPTFALGPPSQNNCVVFFDGVRITAQGSPSISAPTGYTQTISSRKVVNSTILFGSCYQIQTTAASIAANTAMIQSPSDSSAQSCQGMICGALPLQIAIPPGVQLM